MASRRRSIRAIRPRRRTWGRSGFPPGGVFRAALDAVVVMDSAGLVRDWNPAAQSLFGHRRADALGQEVAELIIPGPMRNAHREGLRRYLETGEATLLDRRLELSALRRDGSEFAVELAVSQLPGVKPSLFAGFIRPLAPDSSNPDNLRLQKRLAFLAQAGLVLDRSLDSADTLASLADLTVPDLAQLTVIDLLAEGRSGPATIAASQDPSQAKAVETMRQRHPLDLSGEHPVAEVVRTGQSILLPTMSEGFLRRIAQSDEHYDLMHDLQYRSAIVVPLRARARTLGTLSLLRMAGSLPYDEDDLILAEELARRAALAVDNARLFEATRHVARTLQESLLPERFPHIPGVRITGRYRPAEEGLEVGGDFYDTFAIDEDRWGIAIGDVSGKGAEAASLTALARYTIRALAGRDPSTVLRRLNEAVIRERDVVHERFLTALFAVATIEDDRLQLEVAVGGHPAPLVMRQGRIERVSAGGPLIGMTDDAEFHSQRVALSRGDAILLYTDGLTDARAPACILTESDLIRILDNGRGREGQELAEYIERGATDGESARDDIAMLLIERLGESGPAAALGDGGVNGERRR